MKCWNPFRSPLRGPWLTSMFSAALLAGMPLIIITGLLSYIAYGPQLGQAIPANVGWLHLPVFAWPTSPSWLYRLTQGVHVIGGLMLIPIVLAKLWSVMPKLFAWPPVTSPAQLVERLSLLLLVGSVLFEIVTGVLNIQYDYVFGFSFYTGHYFGAWVFIGAFVLHAALKLPAMVHGLRRRSLRAELRTPRHATRPEPPDTGGLSATAPGPPTLSRRGALGLAGGGSLLIAAVTVGVTIDGPVRHSAFLLPRGLGYGGGPTGFPVNHSAAAARVTAADTGPDWRLVVTGDARTVALSRRALLAMPQHTATLPIACVEGWATTQTWTGVRLRDLAATVGTPRPGPAHVRSLQRHGAFNQARLLTGQVRDPDALLALRVNGADLSLDHGYPARIIVPALPGVHNTKWVRSIDFRTAGHA